MNNRVLFTVKPFPSDNPKEYIVSAEVGIESALIAVLATQSAAETFAAAMNNAMDVADGHPRRSR